MTDLIDRAAAIAACEAVQTQWANSHAGPLPAAHCVYEIKALPAAVAACEWCEDDNGLWHTGCGHLFFFDTDGPVENKQKFCGYCGKPMVSVSDPSVCWN